MVNLWEETIRTLQRYKKSFADVLYVSDSKCWCTMDEFEQRARDINYDNGYGCNEIKLSLKIVGDYWWLERHEYDGSEHWVHKTMPMKPEQRGNPKIMYEV